MGTAQDTSSSEVDGVLRSRQTFSFKPYKIVSEPGYPYQALTRDVINGVQLPKPRSGHRIVCDDINVYSFGGYNPLLNQSDEEDLGHGVWSQSKPLFKELWKYNISKGTWTKLNAAQIPDILASNAVILSGRILMVYGGTGVPFGSRCSKDLYICDLKSDEDQLKFNLITATGSCPQPQYGQAIVLSNHYLYTIGGTTGFTYTCDIHRLNLRNNEWEIIYTCRGTDNEPSGRYRHEVVFDGYKIYILGGGTAHLSYGFKTIFGFNLSTCTWEKISTSPDKSREAYPAARRCHSCVQYGQYAYIIGGLSGHSLLKDIWRLNLVTFEWKNIPRFSLGKGVYFHSSCLTPSGKLITFGGIVESNNNSKRSAAIHTAWLCIPKLKEICWEAVLFYYPYLKSLSKEELIMFGLPYEFIQRLDLPK